MGGEMTDEAQMVTIRRQLNEMKAGRDEVVGQYEIRERCKSCNSDVVKVQRSLLERLTDAMCYAAWNG
jgi:hypothetical protein